VATRLREAGLRISVDPYGESLARRIAVAHDQSVPFIAVVGSRERAACSVALRSRAGQETLPIEAAIAHLIDSCRSPFRRGAYPAAERSPVRATALASAGG
jgi:threonyl-tRNA synthetase